MARYSPIGQLTKHHWAEWEEEFGPIRSYMKELGINWKDVINASVESSAMSVSLAFTVETFREVNGHPVKGKFEFDYTPPL